MSTFNSADMPVLQVQLDVVQQEISYNGTIKVIPETYWNDELVPFLYPLWDSDKDKLIMFNWYTNNTFYAKRRKYKKNFSTGEYQWVDYEMEQVAVSEAEELKNKLVEGFYLIDTIENAEFQQELARMYQKQKAVSPFSLRLARNFLLSETDWAIGADTPLDDAGKQMYMLYRSKLRDLTDTTEFSTNPEGTKFPISPDFYTKVFAVDNPDIEYLSTDEQFLPIGRHYLKLFRDKIANYLVMKSLTENNYFGVLLLEYEKATNPPPAMDEEDLTQEERDQRKIWLDELLAHLQSQIDEQNGGAA